MATKIIVCVKQVLDPETPLSAFKIDRDAKKAVFSPGADPVINGFDEVAVEAALRIKESAGASITVLSMGKTFVPDVIRKPLAMGADNLILLQDDAFERPDSYMVANVLAAAIRKIGGFDLILCGRQASDWDNAQVPLGLAELMNLPCITVAKKVDLVDGHVRVHRITADGYEIAEAPLPAVVTVSNELGEPRTPTIKGIMRAAGAKPTVWGRDELGVDVAGLSRIETADVFIPARERRCEFIEGEDEADAGRKLALKLREAKII
ncbi:MAG: electron transfer flavoprotein subunit beta/FixA family protein [Deltaproteobacteria bacterium]|nr:electron transfer flavoprotein subunit beta/FixA family protein [Deltaproteobacteria bacterium]